MAFELPYLPYSKDELEPHISTRTLEFHHGKHHQAYITNLNNLLIETPLAATSLEEIICETVNDEKRIGIFNNAAQAWNHEFFWRSLSPSGGGKPPTVVEARLIKDFGSVASFVEQFKNAGLHQFGSGWVWLVDEAGALKVMKTANAMTPLAMGLKPLVTCDVWEHAYYLDFQNRRADFLQVFLDHLINWDFVAANMAQ